MQHRRLRLGDILDDYCPRERRVTNHAIVAIVGDEVKQTRCTTCDAEHEYKQARIPPARRKRLEGAAPGAPEGTLRPRTAAGEPDEVIDQPEGDEALLIEDDDQEVELQAEDGGVEAEAEAETEANVLEAAGAEGADAPADNAADDEERPAEDDGPVHRRLIRATLPRPEGQMPERKEPEFTIRQPGGRPGGRGRPGSGRGPQRPGGGGQPRFGQGPPRHGGGGQGQGHGQGQGRPFGGNRPGGAPGGHRGGGRPGGQGGQGGQGQGQGQGRGGGGGRKRGR